MNQIYLFSTAGRPLSIPRCDRGTGTLPRITASVFRTGARRWSQWHHNGQDLVHDTGSDPGGQFHAGRYVPFLGREVVEDKGVCLQGTVAHTQWLIVTHKAKVRPTTVGN